MKKILSFINALALYLFLTPALAYAAPIIKCDTPNNQFQALCNLSTENIGTTLGTLITFAFVGAIIIALIWLVWGGVKWIMSGGDKTAVEEARNHIVSAVLGLVIVFLAYFALNIVVFFFTGKSLFQIEIPTLPAQ